MDRRRSTLRIDCRDGAVHHVGLCDESVHLHADGQHTLLPCALRLSEISHIRSLREAGRKPGFFFARVSTKAPAEELEALHRFLGSIRFRSSWLNNFKENSVSPQTTCQNLE